MRWRSKEADALRPGEIVLRHATRSYSVRAEKAGTLKGALLGRRVKGPEPVRALEDVTLHIAPGETVGLVGRNGAGKTSTLRTLAGIIPLESGTAACGGRIVSLLELAGGFSRDFSGLENIYLQAALYGFDRRETEERLERIIAFSELGGFIDVPVKTYSAGMFVRLGFSIATHLDADVLLIDEVLAVGDEAFQRKCLRRISEQIAAGATLLLVSHDLAAIERVCERVIVMDGGRLAFDGPTAEGLLHYRKLVGAEHGGGASHRPATAGPADVVDLELRDGAGRVANVFGSGSALHVHAALRGRERGVNATLALELRSAAGLRLHGTSIELPSLTEEESVLSYEVADLPLLAGDYDLTLSVGDGREEPLPQRTVHFTVSGASSAEGVLDLRGEWQLASAAERIR